MDWNGLKTFLSIAQAGSLAAAAKQLGVNHSTVYRRLQAFESELGSKLFNQVGNQYVLTDIGENLVAQGADIQGAFNDIERTLVGKEQQPKGLVKITAPFNIANQILPNALKNFRHEYPDIHIEVLSSNQALNMNSRMADIAVRATATPPEHLIGRKVCEFEWGLFASENYLKQTPALTSETDLNQHHLIGGTGAMLDLPAFSWLEKHFGHNIRTRCDELTAMSYFAQQHQGVALLPMDQNRPEIKLVMPLPHLPASQIWLLTHPDLRKTERIRLVMEALTQYFEN
ncbi:MAG: LysR family transcriptional regulator [Gammaproteobacteria bacterium]|nr:LysR family transcriptional regulator [Gammaproteobacteria bacterium]